MRGALQARFHSRLPPLHSDGIFACGYRCTMPARSSRASSRAHFRFCSQGRFQPPTALSACETQNVLFPFIAPVLLGYRVLPPWSSKKSLCGKKESGFAQKTAAGHFFACQKACAQNAVRLILCLPKLHTKKPRRDVSAPGAAGMFSAGRNPALQTGRQRSHRGRANRKRGRAGGPRRGSSCPRRKGWAWARTARAPSSAGSGAQRR